MTVFLSLCSTFPFTSGKIFHRHCATRRHVTMSVKYNDFHSLRVDVSYSLYFPREAKAIVDVCAQASFFFTRFKM